MAKEFNPKMAPTVWLATLDLGGFEFTSIGTSLVDALNGVELAWNLHARTHGADYTLFEADYVSLTEMVIGEGYRDREPLTDSDGAASGADKDLRKTLDLPACSASIVPIDAVRLRFITHRSDRPDSADSQLDSHRMAFDRIIKTPEFTAQVGNSEGFMWIK